MAKSVGTPVKRLAQLQHSTLLLRVTLGPSMENTPPVERLGGVQQRYPLAILSDESHFGTDYFCSFTACRAGICADLCRGCCVWEE